MMNACPRWSFLAVPVLAAFGCSDPVPLPAQGAATLGLYDAQDASSGSCPIIGGKSYQVGAKKKVGTVTMVQAPNTLTPGLSVIDGESGTSVSCSVKKTSAGTYAFSGSLHASTGENDPITVTIVNGTIAADQVMGSGEVSIFTPQLAGTFDSGATPCAFTVINKQVKGGSIWASFSCPSIAQPPSHACSVVNSSVIVFENCSGS